MIIGLIWWRCPLDTSDDRRTVTAAQAPRKKLVPPSSARASNVCPARRWAAIGPRKTVASCCVSTTSSGSATPVSRMVSAGWSSRYAMRRPPAASSASWTRSRIMVAALSVTSSTALPRGCRSVQDTPHHGPWPRSEVKHLHREDDLPPSGPTFGSSTPTRCGWQKSLERVHLSAKASRQRLIEMIFGSSRNGVSVSAYK